MIKTDSTGFSMLTNLDARESEDMPQKEVQALSNALRDKDMALISFMYIMPAGAGALIPKHVEQALLKPEHRAVLEACIRTLKVQLEMFERMRSGKAVESDGKSTSISDPLKSMQSTGGDVN